jgi:hypothetical protein
MLGRKKPLKVETPPQRIPTTPTEYPDGVAVETDTARYYIKGQFKYVIPSDRVLYSWAFPYVMKSSDAALSKYVKRGKLGFRPGSLLFNDGRYYLVSGSVLRKISGPDVFETFGLDPSRALWVSDEEMKLHKAGEVF